MIKVFKNVHHAKSRNSGAWHVNFINGYFLKHEINIKIIEFNFVSVTSFVRLKVSSNSLHYFWLILLYRNILITVLCCAHILHVLNDSCEHLKIPLEENKIMFVLLWTFIVYQRQIWNEKRKVLPALERINSASVVISERLSCNCFICPKMSSLQYSSEVISSTKVSFPRGMIGPQFDPRISPKLHFSILNQHLSVNALNASP